MISLAAMQPEGQAPIFAWAAAALPHSVERQLSGSAYLGEYLKEGPVLVSRASPGLAAAASFSTSVASRSSE
ncbi:MULTISPECIES: hypothetical protein [unclassified Bradyrhizobium]|uniref:hypothetical protein n=1 Tax=unclassified Bradyrhizobium TaxID=2631580 RepID=UPI001FF72C6E|nr:MULTISPECIES: hypothetical protein [unclassified Bradyrhizobium]MCK1296512.1 hypothetical protein [Bradyrhizobium sp. 30]MCK1332895.1 hypothetical protein [Bradyrhizobium sp. CW9]MCK1345109.1 hypothetical protein [Bradyrhizobium sp. CW11]MCK1353251.1 hypothetical protein [Bradyrhizobium sp. CW7]MCK1469208.1 hypothetical protein [Bradyrhizobium sp. CW10]